ncbi:hypothetical protein VQ042_17635 [Aurantimonas sp. A2-1-M11]|uniref:hypothetical protein n=1 Tax=Aurantimonas sp. A2-1-M11 TaxID=3113712 RepID=UPI002F9320F3
MTIPLHELAEELGWTGRQFKDFRRKALRPALVDLGLDDALSNARPLFLDLRSETTTSGMLAIAGRRIGRTGLLLDSPPLRAKLRANRGRLGDLPTNAVDDQKAHNAMQPPLRQGIVW